MDEFEQSNSEKETNASHNTCYQNAICYEEKENAFIKTCKCGLFLLSLFKNYRRTTEDRQGHEGQIEFITM